MWHRLTTPGGTANAVDLDEQLSPLEVACGLLVPLYAARCARVQPRAILRGGGGGGGHAAGGGRACSTRRCARGAVPGWRWRVEEQEVERGGRARACLPQPAAQPPACRRLWCRTCKEVLHVPDTGSPEALPLPAPPDPVPPVPRCRCLCCRACEEVLYGPDAVSLSTSKEVSRAGELARWIVIDSKVGVPGAACSWEALAEGFAALHAVGEPAVAEGFAVPHAWRALAGGFAALHGWRALHGGAARWG